MAYYNIQLPTDIERNAVDITEWDVDIVETDSFVEDRNLRHMHPRRTYDISYGIADVEHIASIKRFMKVIRGPWISFGFKDYSDFSSADSPADAITNTDQVLEPVFANEGDTTTRTFQIIKRYSLLDQYPHLPANSDYVYKVTKPIANTVIIGGTSRSFTVNEQTGEITFSGNLAPGITCGYEYNVPVRLERKVMRSVMVLDDVQNIPSIPLIEVFGE